METAHPFKFKEILKESIGFTPPIPPSVKRFSKRKGSADRLKSDYSAFKKYLLEKVK